MSGVEREAGAGATPGPWRVGFRCEDSGWVDLKAAAAPFPHIIGSARGSSFETNCANAELIVRAVNSHADLLAALQGLLTRYVTLVESGDAGLWDAEKEPQVIAARAAIARATGVAE